MHYANGREAKIGDLVRGKGYNFKHEIIGILVKAKPNEASCNCTIVTVGRRHDSQPMFQASVYLDENPLIGEDAFKLSGDVRVVAELEYGQLDAFVALDPKTGEVLSPL